MEILSEMLVYEYMALYIDLACHYTVDQLSIYFYKNYSNSYCIVIVLVNTASCKTICRMASVGS